MGECRLPEHLLAGPKELRVLREKELFFIDRDGTLAVEDRVIDGARSFLARLREKNRSFYILTNNSSRTPYRHYERLRGLGLDLRLEHVLVSIQSALSFLRSSGVTALYWVANHEVGAYIEQEGFVFEDRDPEALLLTYDDQLTYDKLRILSRLVRRGLPYYATHADLVCPAAEGPVPDIGTFIKVITITTGREPDRIFGKPYREFITPVLEQHGLTEEQAVIIGDRLYTDIRLGRNTNLTSVLVLSGETKAEDYRNTADRADIVVEDLGALLDYI